MVEFDKYFDGMEGDPEDSEELRELDSFLLKLVESAPTEQMYLLNIPRVKELEAAAEKVRHVFEDCRLEIHIPSDLPLWAGVFVISDYISADDMNTLQEIFQMADCFDIYAKLDGTVSMCFTFNSLMLPIWNNLAS